MLYLTWFTNLTLHYLNPEKSRLQVLGKMLPVRALKIVLLSLGLINETG